MYNHMDIDMDIYMYILYQSHWPLPIDGSSRADLQVHAAVQTGRCCREGQKETRYVYIGFKLTLYHGSLWSFQ